MNSANNPSLNIPSGATGPVALKSEIGSNKNRKKIPLRPGYSLADWIRQCRENPGINKVNREGKSPDQSVNDEELGVHSISSDCWIALRGKVYNVTKYLNFHPGGPDEILQVAGKDATDSFNEIHAWVNYESLLKSCYVAPYAGTSKFTRKGQLSM